MPTQMVAAAQEYMLRNPDLASGGWLIYDYRRSNPSFWQVVGEDVGMVTRPCYLFIPPEREPGLLVHHVDAGKFHNTGIDLAVYRDRRSMLDALARLLPHGGPIAMEYSPMGALPRISKVDAGTVELVESLGVEVISSADLLQYATQRWTREQLSSHMCAADKLGRIVLSAFDDIGRSLSRVTEFQVAEFIRARFKEDGLQTNDGPVVAINQHSSDPHYEPSPQGGSVIGEGDWVLIDLWVKELSPDSVYADITWVAYVGEEVPPGHLKVFAMVAAARDSALRYLQDSARQGSTLQGCQVDRVAREYISSRGYGDYFTHRLGHSIGQEVHGDGVNLDSFETVDVRKIIPGICFSIEPGIYLPEFGVRSEIDVYMSEEGPYATTPIQKEVVVIRV